MRLNRGSAAVAALALVVVLAGCGGGSKKSSSPSSSSSATAAAPDSVTIQNFSFSPAKVTVKAGATVTVTNKDGTDHTVTADDKTSFDTKHVSGGKSATFTAPSKAGTYTFHCAIHQYMKGTLVVQ